jgi:uncharacterized membrane protein
VTRKLLAWISIALVVAMVVSAVFVGNGLPADMRLPIHWGLSGEPDNFAGKWVALMIPAGMTALMALLGWFLPILEPRSRNFARSQGLYLWAWASMLLVGVAVHVVIMATALDWNLPTRPLILGGSGLLLLLIGNQFAKSRSMFLLGLRTPWTLASEEVWVRTHRLAGKLMVLAGLAILISALLPLPSGPMVTVALLLLLLLAIIPIVYSFILWRRLSSRGEPAGDD